MDSASDRSPYYLEEVLNFLVDRYEPFQCMLGCMEGEIGIVYTTKIGRKLGMPLFSWWSEEVTAETLTFWRLKFQGLGVRKAPAQVVLLRSFFL